MAFHRRTGPASLRGLQGVLRQPGVLAAKVKSKLTSDPPSGSTQLPGPLGRGLIGSINGRHLPSQQPLFANAAVRRSSPISPGANGDSAQGAAEGVAVVCVCV